MTRSPRHGAPRCPGADGPAAPTPSRLSPHDGPVRAPVLPGPFLDARRGLGPVPPADAGHPGEADRAVRALGRSARPHPARRRTSPPYRRTAASRTSTEPCPPKTTEDDERSLLAERAARPALDTRPEDDEPVGRMARERHAPSRPHAAFQEACAGRPERAPSSRPARRGERRTARTSGAAGSGCPTSRRSWASDRVSQGAARRRRTVRVRVDRGPVVGQGSSAGQRSAVGSGPTGRAVRRAVALGDRVGPGRAQAQRPGAACRSDRARSGSTLAQLVGRTAHQAAHTRRARLDGRCTSTAGQGPARRAPAA